MNGITQPCSKGLSSSRLITKVVTINNVEVFLVSVSFHLHLSGRHVSMLYVSIFKFQNEVTPGIVAS